MSYPPEIVFHALWWFLVVVGLFACGMLAVAWTWKLASWLDARAHRRDHHPRPQ